MNKRWERLTDALLMPFLIQGFRQLKLMRGPKATLGFVEVSSWCSVLCAGPLCDRFFLALSMTQFGACSLGLTFSIRGCTWFIRKSPFMCAHAVR